MLTVVRIPDGCALFDSAFRDCNRLDHIEGRIGRLGPSAFEDSGIRSAELDVPEVEQNAFYQCHRLTSVKLGPNVSRIQYCAFRECWSLKSINMPNVRQVAAHAFRGCTAITSISIGNPELNALVDNNDYAPFRGCSGIRTAVFGFRTGNRVLRLMQNLGLTENQACKVTVASADFNPSFALLLQGLISAGFAPTMYRGTLLVAFDEAEGLTAEQADALAGVI
jgi:hypothetical protein